MSETPEMVIPADIEQKVDAEFFRLSDQIQENIAYIFHAAAHRIVAEEREIWKGRDDPATTVYGRLLHKHMEAAREDFDGPRRAKIFDLIEAFREQFPEECAVWESRYSSASDHQPTSSTA